MNHRLLTSKVKWIFGKENTLGLYLAYYVIYYRYWPFVLSDRTYCNTDEHPEHRYLTQIEAIKLYLSGHEPHLQC